MLIFMFYLILTSKMRRSRKFLFHNFKRRDTWREIVVDGMLRLKFKLQLEDGIIVGWFYWLRIGSS
jgi:hypothetical protein